MSIWFTSDEHYNHAKILHLCNRPFPDIANMKHELIKRHNSIVDKDDITYHIGDFMFSDNWREVAQVLNRLNGSHVLCIGNHDWIYVWNYVEAGFGSVHTSLELDGYIMTHDPAIAGVLKHLDFIHGHVHGLALNIAPNCYNVSVEMHNYTPVNFETIKEYFVN